MPEAAAAVFGERLPLARRYADALATSALERGLIGPREVPRIWDRHLLNCAVIHTLIPRQSTVVDVGSGAGLPGLVLAVVRPDLRITLVEPLQRRVTWLSEIVDELGLGEAVEIHRGRADSVQRSFDVATARAVAQLVTLSAWCLPLVRPGGMMIAIKGESAAAELEASQDELRALGAVDWTISRCGAGVVDPETIVVRIGVGESDPAVRRRQGKAGRRKRPAGPRRSA